MYVVQITIKLMVSCICIDAGIFDTLTKVAKNEKLPGLYRGFVPTLIAIAPFVAIQQITYDLLKHQASTRNFKPSVWLFLGCGSLAGAAAQTVC